MAEKKCNSGKLTIAVGDLSTFVFGDAGMGGASAWLFHILKNGATFSLLPQARVRGQQPETDALAMVPVPYRKIYLNGAVGDDTFGSAPITDTSIIVVPSTGMSVGLVCSALSVAPLIIYAVPQVDNPSL